MHICVVKIKFKIDVENYFYLQPQISHVPYPMSTLLFFLPNGIQFVYSGRVPS